MKQICDNNETKIGYWGEGFSSESMEIYRVKPVRNNTHEVRPSDFKKNH